MSLKFNIIRIIKEELDRWFDDEPTLLDKYYEKKYGVGKPQEQPQPEQIDGELIGYLDKSWERKLDKPIPVYKNPKTLRGFEPSARGVLLENGDFFLGKSSNAMHWNILQLLVKLGYIANTVPIASYGTTEPEEFITVIRIHTSNYFGQSEAYDKFPIYYQVMFDEANKKHSYKFTYLGANN